MHFADPRARAPSPTTTIRRDAATVAELATPIDGENHLLEPSLGTEPMSELSKRGCRDALLGAVEAFEIRGRWPIEPTQLEWSRRAAARREWGWPW